MTRRAVSPDLLLPAAVIPEELGGCTPGEKLEISATVLAIGKDGYQLKVENVEKVDPQEEQAEGEGGEAAPASDDKQDPIRYIVNNNK